MSDIVDLSKTETIAIDALFLELSQFTKATTRKEAAMASQLRRVRAQCDRIMRHVLNAGGTAVYEMAAHAKDLAEDRESTGEGW